MPGTTDSQALPFDYLDEVVSSVPVKNFADAVALKLDAKDVQRASALKRPFAIARRAAPQTVNDVTATTITFDTEVSDSHGMIDLGTQPTRITVSASAGAGLYFISAYTDDAPASGPTLVGRITVFKNGSSTVYVARRQYLNFAAVWHCTGYAVLAVADFLTVSMFHDSPGSESTSGVLLRVYKVAN